MAIALSPSVTVREIDLTNVVPAVSTSIGAAVVEAAWGPVQQPVLIDSENVLVELFGKPNKDNAASWFTAANFLSYSNNLLVVRSDTQNQRNAVSVLTGSVQNIPGIPVVSGGAGYKVGETFVTISAPSVTGNVVTSIPITFGGAGYTTATCTITLAAPPAGGVNATARAVLDTNGTIVGVVMTNRGSGYSTAPAATVSGTNTTPATLGTPVIQAGEVGITATAEPVLTYGAVERIIGGTGGTLYTTATVAISAPTGSDALQATATATISSGAITAIVITNPGRGYLANPTVTITGDGSGALAPTAVLGNYISSIEITNPGTGYTTAAVTVTIDGDHTIAAVPGTPAVIQGGIKINNESFYTQYFENGQGIVGEFAAKYPGVLGNSLKVSMADAASYATWEYKGYFDAAPGTSDHAAAGQSLGDELHIIIADSDGRWSGIAGSVLETFAFVSKASDAKRGDGSTAYYKAVLNTSSKYVWWMDHPVVGTNWGTEAKSVNYASIGASAITRNLIGGVDHFIATEAQKIKAFNLFANDEEMDVNLIMLGKASTTLANWVIQNVAEVRKDCMAFVSPHNLGDGSALISVGSSTDIVNRMIAYRNQLPSTSFAVMDSGYKYQYDRYNDVYRWVPLNGDVAGLCARTDYTNDPWFSPAGLNRGTIKNVVKLGFSPRRAERDMLYKNGINPVVAFPGQGVVLYGDKTMLAKPSAFDRINVRRLFITLEKAISTSAKYQLFEFNDQFTRAQFRNTVEPYLRDVQGRRGIYDYKVICDESNNTSEVIDTNRFVASIFIKPARSINFMQLNFVATRTSASFEEIAGAV